MKLLAKLVKDTPMEIMNLNGLTMMLTQLAKPLRDIPMETTILNGKLTTLLEKMITLKLAKKEETDKLKLLMLFLKTTNGLLLMKETTGGTVLILLINMLDPQETDVNYVFDYLS